MAMTTIEVPRDNRDIDTERVIGEVRMRRCLWDPSDQLYKSKDARMEAWGDIVIALFGDLPPHEKTIMEKLIQQRWKTSRDAYFRSKPRITNLPSGSCGKKYKKYIYYKELSFLDNIEVNLVKESIAESTYPTDISSQNENENTPNTDDTMSLQNKQLVGSDTKDRKYVNNREINNTRYLSPQQDSQFENELLALLSKQTSDISSDDLAFFSSLGPILKNFDLYQKLEFRSRVLDVAKDLLFKTCPADCQQKEM